MVGDREVSRRYLGLAAALFVGALLQAQSGPTARRSSASLRMVAGIPAVSALNLSGNRVDPFQMSDGKALVLIFMRTDCPISNRYAPTIQALSKKYAGTAVMILVYPDKSETAQDIEKHLQEYGYKIPALRDTQRELVNVSKVEITPEAAVFDRSGELIYHGRIDNWYKDFGHARAAPTTHELDQAIQATVGGTQAPASIGGVGCYISDLQ